MMAILKTSIEVIFGKNVPIWFYVVLLSLSILAAGSYADHFAEGSKDFTILQSVNTIASPILLVVLIWHLTRYLGQADKKGSVLAWVAWMIPPVGIVLVLYGSSLMLPIDLDETSWPRYWAVEAAVMAVAVAISAPFFVVSTGRALAADGPPVMRILGATKPCFLALFSLFFGLFLVDGFCSSAFNSNFGEAARSDIQAFGVSALAGFSNFAATVLQTAIVVVVYRKIEANLSSTASS